MTSTEVALPEASLNTNLDGCGFARGGGDMERAEAVAGKRAAQPTDKSVMGRIFRIGSALYSAQCAPDKRFFDKISIIAATLRNTILHPQYQAFAILIKWPGYRSPLIFGLGRPASPVDVKL